MDFDEIDDLDEYYDNQMNEYTTEQLNWHENIFKFLNPNNILYIPEQHFPI